MDNQLTLIIVVAMLVIIFAAVGAWVYTRSSRSRRLKAKFGPEYDQTVERFIIGS
jgi:protein-S-isoprenylcysteine O-methyltransferase Ste14